MLLMQKLRGRALLRVLYFAPFVLSEVVTGVVWQLMLQPNGLANPSTVLYVLFVVISWKYFGFHMVLYLAGLQQIPRELEEAALIDGARRWEVLRFITLPLLGPTIRIWIFLSVIGSLQLFDLVWIMTLGGPAGASTTMATYLIDRGFRRYEFGYGSAVAVILFVICFVFALLYQRFALRRDMQGAVTRMVGA
jgi:raffinose/stachyose/melibiose transport system permease protein